MDITKVADEEKLRLCKWYFKGKGRYASSIRLKDFLKTQLVFISWFSCVTICVGSQFLLVF